MVDVMSTISLLTTATGMAKGMMDVKESVAVSAKAAELLSVIIDAQMKLQATQAELFGMQQALQHAQAELKKRDDIATLYELIEPYQGTRIYRRKQSDSLSKAEANAVFCPTCLETKHMPITLQGEGVSLGCNHCKNFFQIKASDRSESAMDYNPYDRM